LAVSTLVKINKMGFGFKTQLYYFRDMAWCAIDINHWKIAHRAWQKKCPVLGLKTFFISLVGWQQEPAKLENIFCPAIKQAEKNIPRLENR
jgi:hypothetical protein